MNLTIVVADNAVTKDGVGHGGLDLSTCSIPADVWALQWAGTSGEVEYKGQAPNELIDELPSWATAVEAVWQSAQDNVQPDPEELEPVAEPFWDSYPVANAQSVDTILLKTYEGITNARGADPIANTVKTVETTVVAAGATALSSLATLLNDCKALGVPVTSDPMSDANQNFLDYMTGLGYTVYEGVTSDGQAYKKSLLSLGYRIS